MLTLFYSGLFLVLFQVQRTSAAADRRVTACYYTNWSQYRKELGQFKPGNLSPRLCTHVFYAFANIDNSTLSLKHTEWNDIPTKWDQGNYRRVVSMKRKNPFLRVFLSVGGWKQGSAGFSSIIRTNQTRHRFAENAISFLRQHRFDGLDLDWEYPGSRGSPREDIERYCQLIKTLREAFEEEFASRISRSRSRNSIRRRLQISTAVPSTSLILDGYSCLDSIAIYADLVITPAYNYHGNWEWFAAPGGPLFAASDEIGIAATLNVNWTVTRLLEIFPPEKLLLGMPLFAKTYKLENAGDIMAGSPAVGPGDKGNYTGEEGILAYYEVCEMMREEGWRSYWDAERAVPIAVNGATWVGYEDTRSLVLKALLARERGLGGVALWALDLDDFKGQCGQGKFPLVNNIRRALSLWNGNPRRAFPKQQRRQKRQLSTEAKTEVNMEANMEALRGWLARWHRPPVPPGDNKDRNSRIFSGKVYKGILEKDKQSEGSEEVHALTSGSAEERKNPESFHWKEGKEIFGEGMGEDKNLESTLLLVTNWTLKNDTESWQSKKGTEVVNEDLFVDDVSSRVITNRHKRSTSGSEVEDRGSCEFDSVIADKTDCRYYYQCSDGRLFLFFCGPGAVFDPEVKSCVSPNRLERCAGVSTAMEEPNNGVLYVCDTDGYYRDPKDCNKFYRCADKVKHYFSCPDGLVFKESSSSCDFPIHVKECKNYQSAAQPQTTGPFDPDYRSERLAGSARVRGVQPERVKEKKKERLNGGKSVRFERLSPGSFSVEDLPSIPITKYRESERDAERERTGEAEVDGSFLRMTKTPLGGFDCPGDGYYRDTRDCQKFYHCSNGMSYQISCNGGLVFNYLTGICDWPDRVPGCGIGYHNSRNLTQEEEEEEDGRYYIDLDTVTSIMDTGDVTENTFMVEAVPDQLDENGAVPMPAYRHRSPDPEAREGSTYKGFENFYDEDSPIKKADLDVYNLREERGDLKKLEIINKEPLGNTFHDCKPTGFRRDPDDCRVFYICSADGTEHRFRCAEELVFNIEKGYCEPPDAVPGCGYTGEKHRDKGTYCSPGAVIAHPHSCNRYLRCVAGTWMVNSCPASTSFNERTSQCEESDRGMPCIHNIPRKFKAQNHNPDEEKQDDQASGSHVVHPEKNMEEKGGNLDRNPVHGGPCQEDKDELLPDKTDCVNYFRCVQGMFVRMRCEQRLAFRADLGLCDWEELVPSCDLSLRNVNLNYNKLDLMSGGESEEEEEEEEENPKQNDQNYKTVDWQEISRQQMSGFVCPKDGLFSHPYDCSYYYKCKAGVPSSFKCPSGLVFDSLRQVCDHVQKVPECFMYQIEAPHFNSLPMMHLGKEAKRGSFRSIGLVSNGRDRKFKGNAKRKPVAFWEEEPGVDSYRKDFVHPPRGKSADISSDISDPFVEDLIDNSDLGTKASSPKELVKKKIEKDLKTIVNIGNSDRGMKRKTTEENEIKYIPYDVAETIEDFLNKAEVGIGKLPTVENIQAGVFENKPKTTQKETEGKGGTLGHYVHGAVVKEISESVRLNPSSLSDEEDGRVNDEREKKNEEEEAVMSKEEGAGGGVSLDEDAWLDSIRVQNELPEVTTVRRGPFLCTRSGYFADVEECSMYYKCSSDLEVSHMTCPGNLVYNENTALCDEPFNVPECFDGNLEYDLLASQPDYITGDNGGLGTDTFTPDKDFTGVPCIEGPPVPDPNDCSRFYQCRNSGLQIIYCPENKVFNEQRGRCDHPWRVPHCLQFQEELTPKRYDGNGEENEGNIEKNDGFGERKEKPSTETPTVKPVPKSTLMPYKYKHIGSPRVKCPASGYVRDPKDCSLFYFCSGSMVYEFQCAAGLAFDPEQLQCEWPSRVPGCEDAWGVNSRFEN